MGYVHHFMRLAKLNRFRDPGDLKKITQKPLDELAIPIMPLSEQKALLAQLASIEKIINDAKTASEALKQLQLSLQTRSFSGEISFNEFETSL